MSSKFRVILIGAGGMGRTHIRGWKNLAENVDVVAVCDKDGQRAADFAAEHGIPKVFTDFHKALKVSADAADICVPNSAHTPAVLAAFKAKLHVLCEKPLAVLPRDVVKMMKARDEARKMLMTAQHMRYQGETQALKAYVETGALGDIYHARAWHLRRCGLPTWGVFALKEFSGGGPCVDIGVHSLDLTLHLMDNWEPVSVVGTAPCMLAHKPGIYNPWGPIDPKDVDVEDFSAGFVRFANGATLILEASWLLHQQPKSLNKVWIYGTEGGIEYPEMTIATQQGALQMDQIITNPTAGNAHEAEIAGFYDAVANKKPSPVPAEQTLQVIKILDGIYRSHEQRKEIKL